MTDLPFGMQYPQVVTPPPGPRSREYARELAEFESPNITYLADDFPVFWESASGANVRDVDGNVYVDLTAAFAVAGGGHANPAVVAAVREQAGTLLHGMGDVHPPRIKAELLRLLAEVTPGDLRRSILANSGAEAVEAALKTVMLATGKARVLAFHGGYHGLTLGGLSVSSREDFRAPFGSQFANNAIYAPFPDRYRSAFGDDPDASRALAYVERLLDTPGSAAEQIGAILVEPVQGRGGDIVPPDAWLPGLRRICDERDLLLVLDEIYTGFGRTGRWFACEHWDVVPDIIVVGKALTGGLPFAACVGTDRVMSAWPKSTGEAIHTSTFLGNPVACAAAIASINSIRENDLVERSAHVGHRLINALRDELGSHPAVGDIRGIGSMIGVDLVKDRTTREPAPDIAGKVMVEALRRGVLVLSGGVGGNVLSLSPPFVITEDQIDVAVRALREALNAASVSS